MSPNFDVYQLINKVILDCMAKGVVPWRKPWASNGRGPVNQNARPYRGINVMLLSISAMLRGYSSPVWMTYRNAEALGGQVRKGEKSTQVVFWARTANKKPCTCAAGIRRHRNGDGCEFRQSFVLRYYSVFNLSQIDGVKLPKKTDLYANPPADGKKKFSPIDAAQAIVDGYADAPVVKFGGDRACYIPTLDEVHVPKGEQFNSCEEFYSALFHELVHSSGSKNRLDRGVGEFRPFGTEDYSKEELVAEFGAAFLCGVADIANQTIPNSAAYLANWSKKLSEEPKWLVQAAAQAQRAADYILGVDPAAEGEDE